MMKLRIGTRKSRLAMVQTELVKAEILKHFPSAEIELVPITTRGDRQLDRSLASFGGKGVFTRELEEALLKGEIDLAVITTPVGPLRPYLKRMDLKSFQDILIGGRQFAELAKQPLQLADLSRYPLISLARDTRTFAFYSQIYMSHDLELDPDIEVATTDLILPMVKNGLGLGFLPQAFAEEALESGSVVQLRLLDPIPGRHICMVWDSHGGLGDPARILRQMLCDCSDRE